MVDMQSDECILTSGNDIIAREPFDAKRVKVKKPMFSKGWDLIGDLTWKFASQIV
jgi:hypothetical protein